MKRSVVCFIISAAIGLGNKSARADAPAIETAPTTISAADATPTTAPAAPVATTDAATLSGATTEASTEATTQSTADLATAPTTQSVANSTTAPTVTPTGATAPSTQPIAATQPSRDSDLHAAPASPSARAAEPGASLGSLQSKPMPRTYSVLTQRSIFEKGRFITDAGPGSSQSGGRDYRVVRDRARESSAVSAVANSPADLLIFNGVTQTPTQVFAFIEDTASNSISLVQSGDLLAGGKVAGVGFDSLDLKIDGKTRHIQIGQTLSGKDVAVAATQPTPLTDSGTGTSTGTGTAAAPANLDPLLERMRKRRQAELGGK